MSSRPASILTDAPGPKALRRHRIYTVVVAMVAVVVVVVAVRRLADRGQLDGDRWRIYTQWSVWRFNLFGLANTAKAAAVGGVLAFALGLVFSLGRVSRRRLIRWLASGYVETFRALPLALLMFFGLLGMPKLGVDLSPFWAVSLALAAYNGAVFAEIIRAGLASLPAGQTEAALSIGMRHGPMMRHVLLPQAFKAMVPALASQLVVLLKDTSLGALVAYEEVLRRGQITGEFAKNPLQALFVAGALYIPLVFVANRLARRLERRPNAAGNSDSGLRGLSAAPSTSGSGPLTE